MVRWSCLVALVLVLLWLPWLFDCRNWTDWMLGVVATSKFYCLGLYESSSENLWPSFFSEDRRRGVYSFKTFLHRSVRIALSHVSLLVVCQSPSFSLASLCLPLTTIIHLKILASFFHDCLPYSNYPHEGSHSHVEPKQRLVTQLRSSSNLPIPVFRLYMSLHGR
ncbi:hypothetical protein GALMADRAFT_918668 [Galerina marginata CBS 339.88]|uniref:Secreted protein n=1 Tax=Galerina marginata (strain CBS 339.88) TaxID=685588 RepID=A0A067SPS3_GALM3|nr:hypothetical protein GALMADRAFT_918668 [Galerina marginata CBS 339.88]